MGVTKIELNGSTLIDLTSDTVAANKMLNGTTAHDSTGTSITGSIVTNTSTNLSVSGATVTAPAGYYASDASKAVASGSATAPASISGSSASISASTNTITLSKTVSVTPDVSAGYVSSGTAGNSDVSLTASATINPTLTASGATVTAPAGYYTTAGTKTITSGSATPAASISGTSASISTGTGTITLSKTVSNTPSVSAGYVSSGTAGNSDVSLTADVTTKAAATITPTTTNQTIASGTYLTGAQTISGDANLIPGNIKSGVTIFNVTGTHSGGSGPDLSSDTITPEDVLLFKTFHDKDGTAQVGTASGDTPWVDNWPVKNDGKSYFYVTVDNDTLDVGMIFSQGTGNGNEIDWGDSSPTETYNGTSGHTYRHTYSTAGNYTISIRNITGTLLFSAPIFLTATGSSYLLNRILRAVEIGGVATISTSTQPFQNCCYLEKIMFTATNITNVTYSWFGGLINLRSVILGSKITTFSASNNIFQNCYGLVSADISGVTDITTTQLFISCRSLTSVKLSNSLTTLPMSMFSGCQSLSQFNLPTSLTSIGVTAFSGCSSITREIVIPSNVTTIWNSAFYGCGRIPSIILPSGLKTIKWQAFYQCYLLKSIDASNVTLFEESTDTTPVGAHFYDCRSLESITLNSTLTRIPNTFLYNCYSLKSITIPSTVISIGNNAFYYCYSLKTITIPASVTTIGNTAFAYMKGCTEFHFLSTTPPTIGTNIFNQVSFTALSPDGVTYPRIYVPAASLDAYKSASNWTAYANYMVGE